MQLQNQPAHTTEVSTPAEYKEAIEAADTLGLELRGAKVRGKWKGRDGAEPSRGSNWSVHSRTSDARKWFYLAGNGYQTFAARPVSSNTECIDAGSLELRFD